MTIVYLACRKSNIVVANTIPVDGRARMSASAMPTKFTLILQVFDKSA